MRINFDFGDLEAFTAFVRHCAGRTGQALNLAALGAEMKNTTYGEYMIALAEEDA